MAQRPKCPNCQKLLVPPAGPPKAPVLIVGEFPGWNEIQRGIPFIGMAGDILKKEFAKVGIQYSACRVTNLWQHAKVKGDAEFSWHLSQCIKEMRGRRAVLLMGSDCAGAFLEDGVLDVAGMKVKSPLFPKDVKLVMISPNPALLIHDTVGEFRLALAKFKREIEKIK